MSDLHITYSTMVKSLAKNGQAIIDDLDSSKAHLLHMAVGVSGEAGELLDAIKREAIYNKVLDIDNVIEELGDIEFYLEGLRAGLGLTREECLVANMLKLQKRYTSGNFSNQQAQDRADKGANQ